MKAKVRTSYYIFMISAGLLIGMGLSENLIAVNAEELPIIILDGNTSIDQYFSGNGTDGTVDFPYIIENTQYSAIQIANNTRYLIIRNCGVQDNIKLIACNNTQVINNTIKNPNTQFLLLNQTGNCRIENNTFTMSSAKGIMILNSKNNTIIHNNITGVWSVAIELDVNSNNNSIIGNNISYSQDQGIFCKGANNLFIENMLYRNNVPILEQGINNTYQTTTFYCNVMNFFYDYGENTTINETIYVSDDQNGAIGNYVCVQTYYTEIFGDCLVNPTLTEILSLNVSINTGQAVLMHFETYTAVGTNSMGTYYTVIDGVTTPIGTIFGGQGELFLGCGYWNDTMGEGEHSFKIYGESTPAGSNVRRSKMWVQVYATGVSANIIVVNGTDGVDGLNGTDGLDGQNGRDGINGTNGKDGIDGNDGKDGKDDTETTSTDDSFRSVDGFHIEWMIVISSMFILKIIRKRK